MEDETDDYEEAFPEDLDPTDKDTTAAQYRAGRDPQGIPWHRMQFGRATYRQRRVYHNYTNEIQMDQYESLQSFHEKEFGAECTATIARDDLFSFYRNFRDVQSSIIHFQLRNLVWATSAHDIYVVHSNCVKHWNMISRESRVVLDLTGATHMTIGLVHVSTCCVAGGIVAAGGFSGELVVASQDGACVMMNRRISESENSITNSIEVAPGVAGAWQLLTANNDDRVRLLDVASCGLISEIPLEWAANYSTANPRHRSLIAVVGDDKDAFLHDTSTTKRVARLSGHKDFSFAAAWHRSGNLLATGNQDCTTRVWDIRRPEKSLGVLKGVLGSIRSCRFSQDGKWLAVAEPADYVHIYGVESGLVECQSIDLFGEISGISFSPDSKSLFIGQNFDLYNSLLYYRREEPTLFGVPAVPVVS